MGARVDTHNGSGNDAPFDQDFSRHALAAFGGLVAAAASYAFVRGVGVAGAVLATVVISAMPLAAALVVYTVAVRSATTRWQLFAWSPLIGVVTLAPLAMLGEVGGARGVLGAVLLSGPAVLTAALARPQSKDAPGNGGRVLGSVCVGLTIGAATVGLAAALGTWDDGWRTEVYFAACAVSGLYPGWFPRGRRAAPLGSVALGQFLAGFASVTPALYRGEGFALLWPMFVVPAGVSIMAGVAAVTATLRGVKRQP